MTLTDALHFGHNVANMATIFNLPRKNENRVQSNSSEKRCQKKKKTFEPAKTAYGNRRLHVGQGKDQFVNPNSVSTETHESSQAWPKLAFQEKGK